MSRSNMEPKKERNLPHLQLELTENTLETRTQPILVINSPKTPTLSKKLKAVSLDSDEKTKEKDNEACRDVFSMPCTPKRQLKQKLSCEFPDEEKKSCNSLLPTFGSNLKKFASNTSISGSQCLKTLPEVMTLQDFSDNGRSPGAAPFKMKAKGLLERRGSNASLTIDLGSNSSISEASSTKVTPLLRLNTAKSVSNLNLSTFGCAERCTCAKRCYFSSPNNKTPNERRKSQEACGNCIIYESIPSKSIFSLCKNKCSTNIHRNSPCCVKKCRRKSLSNENLYIPPCSFCNVTSDGECSGSTKHCKGYRRACYPRQQDIEASQLLSEDFKMHLQNIQYLQTAGCVLSLDELKLSCKGSRVPKLHQEFWEVPLNLQEKCYVSGSQTKNRYRGVLPNEHSRVHLPGPQNYIHANYIKGPDYTETAYIATQGPMAHTCHDFWEMIWHTNCSIIVMLTELVEKGKNKCELYFPIGNKDNKKTKFYVKTHKVKDKFTFDEKHVNDSDIEFIEYEAVNEIKYDNYKIKYIKEEKNHTFTLRHFELSRVEQKLRETRKIYHYWFTHWQDHKMANPPEVLTLALDVLKLLESQDANTKFFDNNIPPSPDMAQCVPQKNFYLKISDTVKKKWYTDSYIDKNYELLTDDINSPNPDENFVTRINININHKENFDNLSLIHLSNHVNEMDTSNDKITAINGGVLGTSTAFNFDTGTYVSSVNCVPKTDVCGDTTVNYRIDTSFMDSNESCSVNGGANESTAMDSSENRSVYTSRGVNGTRSDVNDATREISGASQGGSGANRDIATNYDFNTTVCDVNAKISNVNATFCNVNGGTRNFSGATQDVSGANRNSSGANKKVKGNDANDYFCDARTCVCAVNVNGCECGANFSVSGANTVRSDANMSVYNANECVYPTNVSDCNCGANTDVNGANGANKDANGPKMTVVPSLTLETNISNPILLDYGTNDDLTIMNQKRKRSSDANKVKVPLVVHCSAGIGRTGCFLAILNGILQLKNNFNVDILAILCSLRLNRGGMVQTAEQYELVHRVLNLYADSKMMS